MKARIKKTGEIVNLASYATITLAQCDSWGNPIELKPEEVELIQEPTEGEHLQIDDITDWDYYRIHAAIAAMQGMLSCGEGAFSYQGVTDEIAKVAVDYAGALIEELRKQEKPRVL